ncbi:hypothetical protein LT85_1028 [Collimonas arenae]|uniref:Uncharacterized protein n=1 Tax=Collimonas arenae TaxID=279058 RepID=A0A0A1F6Q0_9BURK|nr:hypothetical protein [Collimonas arenae]AIY40186.1 hypothetical protein LT85_1028 [Collimonas arenae]
MGIFATGGIEQAGYVLTGALSSAVAGAQAPLLGDFNIAVWGTFVGTLTLENSYDAGTTWIPVINKHTGNNITWTTPGALQEDEVEAGVYYRLRMTAFTSGTANWRISQGMNTGDHRRLT